MKAYKNRIITINCINEVKEKLVELGYNPAFGARPLRRVIQEQLEDQISRLYFRRWNSTHLLATLEADQFVIKSK